MTQRKQIRNFWRKMSACVALGGILACAVAQQPDLTVLRVLPAPSDPFTLRVSGSVNVVVQNIGTVASSPCSVVVFTDMNANAQYDAGTDILLGTGSVLAIGANLSATVSVSVLGRVLFWDGWISAYVDYGNAVAESDESNNYGNTGSVCGGSVRTGVLNPRLKWHWGVNNLNNPPRGQYYSSYLNVMMTPAVVDMDGDGYPEVIFAGTDNFGGLCGPEYPGYIFVLDGRDGRQKWVSPQNVRVSALNCPGAGDLDGDGYPEVVFATSGQRLLILKYDLSTSTYTYTILWYAVKPCIV